MNIDFTATTWLIPLVSGITLHEAAHGYVAHRLGDDTAWQAGRVSLNPLRHIDAFGTLILPITLIAINSPVVFGYAKPVPVNFDVLGPRNTVLVAAAGPLTNIALVLLSLALLAVFAGSIPAWVMDNLLNAYAINFSLTLFNLLPFPPLDGWRVLAGLYRWMR